MTTQQHWSPEKERAAAIEALAATMHEDLRHGVEQTWETSGGIQLILVTPAGVTVRLPGSGRQSFVDWPTLRLAARNDDETGPVYRELLRLARQARTHTCRARAVYAIVTFGRPLAFEKVHDTLAAAAADAADLKGSGTCTDVRILAFATREQAADADISDHRGLGVLGEEVVTF